MAAPARAPRVDREEPPFPMRLGKSASEGSRFSLLSRRQQTILSVHISSGVSLARAGLGKTTSSRFAEAICICRP